MAAVKLVSSNAIVPPARRIETPAGRNIFSHDRKRIELQTAQAGVRALKAEILLECLKEFLTLLSDPRKTQEELTAAFYALDRERAPHKVRDFLSLCVWIAEGRPIGDAEFGEHAITKDARILLRIQDEKGRNLVQQLIAYFTAKERGNRFLKDLMQFNALFQERGATQEQLHAAFKRLSPDLQHTLLKRLEQQLMPGTLIKFGHIEIEVDIRILVREKIVEKFIDALLHQQNNQVTLLQASRGLQNSSEAVTAPVETTQMERLVRQVPRREVEKPLSLILVGAESTHLLKQGGLAEAIYGMAEGLAAHNRQNKVRVILPFYDLIPEEVQKRMTLKPEYAFCDRVQQGKMNRVFKAKIGAVKFYFIEDTPTAASSNHFRIGFDAQRKAQSIYGPDDNTVKERFAYFSYCAAELITLLSTKKNKKKKPIDAIHLHDWHSAGVALLLSERYPEAWASGEIPPVVFTFHNNNGGAQGIYARESIPTLQQLGIRRELNMLTEALRIADHVTTVSHTFSLEAQSQTLGAGIHSSMQTAARRGKLTGILNGSNPNVWNPETDALLRNWRDPLTGDPLDLRYGPQDAIVAKKELIREQLQKWIALYQPKLILDFSKPLIAYIGRYDSYQKGIDMLAPAVRATLKMGGQFISMGSQEDDKAKLLLDQLQREVQLGDGSSQGVWIIRDSKGADGRFIVQQGSIGGPPGIGSLIRAVADYVLVPSEFEPCGLVQFESWLFGSLAICTRTGGLADSVQTAGPHFNGFLIERSADFHSNAQGREVEETVEKALGFWQGLSPAQKNILMSRVLREGRQSSWNHTLTGLSPIEKYLYVYAAARQNLGQRQIRHVNTGLSRKPQPPTH